MTGPWQTLSHLWRQFHFQLPGQVLPLKLCILPNVGRDHPLYLLRLEQQAEPEVIHSELNSAQTQRSAAYLQKLKGYSCSGFLLSAEKQS